MHLLKQALVFRKFAEQLSLPAKEANVVTVLFDAGLMPIDNSINQNFDDNHPVAIKIGEIVSEIDPNGAVNIYIAVNTALSARIIVKEKSPKHMAVEQALNAEFLSKINSAIKDAKLNPPDSDLLVPWMIF
jgi:hypothetical protein